MPDLGHFNLAEKQLTPGNRDVSTVFLMGLQYQYHYQNYYTQKQALNQKAED